MVLLLSYQGTRWRGPSGRDRWSLRATPTHAGGNDLILPQKVVVLRSIPDARRGSGVVAAIYSGVGRSLGIDGSVKRPGNPGGS